MNKSNQKTINLGNNESLSIGIFSQDGGFLALTRRVSKTFKTEKGAQKWLIRNFPNVAKEVGLLNVSEQDLQDLRINDRQPKIVRTFPKTKANELPAHLAKFFNKGYSIKDVTPAGYGPTE